LKSQDSSQSSEDDILHYVKGSIRQKGYYRRRPWVYDLPPPNHRKARAQFGKIAHDFGRGEFGKRDIVDKAGVEKEVPSSAVPVMERMVPVKPAEAIRVPVISQVERIRRISDLLAAIAEST
jgi:hypothetical protein